MEEDVAGELERKPPSLWLPLSSNCICSECLSSCFCSFGGAVDSGAATGV